MPAAAVVGAVAAIAVAAEVGTAFAIIAAVGATVGAVGAVTGVKELQYAGLALGAVGAIGGLASSAGLFAGEAAGTLGSVATDAGSWAGAAGEVTAAAAPAGGYTLETIAGSGLPSFEGAISGVGEGATISPTADIIDTITSGTPNFNELPITQGLEVPAATPADVLPDTVVDPAGAAPWSDAPPALDAGQLVAEARPGLIDSTVPTDQFGRPIALGDGQGGTLGTAGNNPGAAVDPVNALPADATGSTPAPAVTVTGRPAGAPADPGTAVTGTTGAESNASGFAPGQGPQGPAQLAARDAAGAPIGTESAWAKILGFAQKNSSLTMGGLMAAGSFLSGAMSPLTPAQVGALESQAANNLAAANLARTQDELFQMRLQNMRAPMPVASRTARPPGLVNSPPPITGTPA